MVVAHLVAGFERDYSNLVGFDLDSRRKDMPNGYNVKEEAVKIQPSKVNSYRKALVKNTAYAMQFTIIEVLNVLAAENDKLKRP